MLQLVHHCRDAFNNADPALRAAMRGQVNFEEDLHGEWRAFAQQAKAAADMASTGRRPPGQNRDLLIAWKSNTFDQGSSHLGQSMFMNTLSYMYEKTGTAPQPSQVQQFVNSHRHWVTEAFGICPPYNGPVP